MDLVHQEYWDNSYKNFQHFVANDAVTDWMAKHALPQLYAGGTLFEFGCYPGRYLAFLGLNGVIVNGMDITPSVGDDSFISWLHSLHIKSGKLIAGDVLEYASSAPDHYDAVCSFGFIEHFRNFDEIITLHDRLLKPGGVLIISTPNFRGPLQWLLHRSLDEENLKRHYLPSMKPGLWKKQLESIGYEIVFSGYFGRFDFWYDYQSRKYLQRFVLKYVPKIAPLLKIFPDSYIQSPYCGLVARKKK